jgi:hypothetical protein
MTDRTSEQPLVNKITLSDEGGSGERARSRRYARREPMSATRNFTLGEGKACHSLTLCMSGKDRP